MTVVLADDGLTVQLPQPSIVIRASCDQVCRIGTESAVPDPALMTCECALKSEGLRRAVCRLRLAGNGDHGSEVLDFPNLGGVVGGASGEVLDVGREENTGNVLLMGREMGDRNERSLFTKL